MCGFFQTLGDNMDYILTEFDEILYCSFWEKVEKLVKNHVEKFSKCQTWVTSLWEIFHVKNFFADFHELKDVDSKNEKKILRSKKFFGSKKCQKMPFLRLNISKTGKDFDVRFFEDAQAQCGLPSD